MMTRKEAKALGLKRYTGNVCAEHPELNGERLASNGQCHPCNSLRSAAWYAANREAATATKRRWTENNKDKKLQKERDWYEANRERHLTTSRENYLADKVLRTAAHRAWREANRDRWNTLIRNRRARERYGADGSFTADDVRDLWDRQNGCCAGPHCATALTVSCTVDHIQPLARGGSNWPANLQLLCKPCNSGKGTKTMDEWHELALAA